MRTCSTVSGSLEELDMQSIEDKSQNYNKLEMFFTEDSLQFHQQLQDPLLFYIYKHHSRFLGIFS